MKGEQGHAHHEMEDGQRGPPGGGLGRDSQFPYDDSWHLLHIHTVKVLPALSHEQGWVLQ
jgi:hypothetical protein